MVSDFARQEHLNYVLLSDAGHKAAAGNVCTEEVVFLCRELGIATGVDLDRLVDCARLAEAIVGHKLPSKLLNAGTTRAARAAQAA